jgi:hypothetical protein
MNLGLRTDKNSQTFCTGGEIRTPINGFGDRHATIAPHPCVNY